MDDKRNNKAQTRTFHTDGAHRRNAGKKRRRVVSSASAPAHRGGNGKPRPADVRRSRRQVLLGLYAVLCVEAGFALLTSPAFAIKTVHVRGLETLPPAEWQQTLQALSVAQNTNWFRAPLGRLRRDTTALPWVQTASVERSYSSTLFVRVAPRQPFLALKAGNAWYETDMDGVPIRLARPRVANRLPRVVLQPPCVIQFGVAPADPALAGAIQIVRQMQQEQPLKMAKIVIDQSDNICLNMRDGMEFQLGPAADLPAKIAIAKRIYARDPDISRMLAAINLSCPTTPACTLRVAQAAPSLLGPLLPPGSLLP